MSIFLWILLFIVVGYFVLVLLRKRRFAGYDCPRKYLENLKGKTILLTGGTDGIGLQFAKTISRYRPKEIILPCRNMKKGVNVRNLLKNDCKISVYQTDFSDLNSVRSFLGNIEDKDIDIMVNNAGIMACPHGVSKDGFEIQFAVNHLGHFFLTTSLLPQFLKSSHDIRIINVSSDAHEWCDSFIDEKDLRTPVKSKARMTIYAHSKLCNVLFTRELAKRYSDSKHMSFFSLNPGAVPGSNLMGNFVPFRCLRDWVVFPLVFVLGFPIHFKTIWEGVQTHLFVTSAPKNVLKNGHFYHMTSKLGPLNKLVKEDEKKGYGERIWRLSEQFVNEVFQKE